MCKFRSLPASGVFVDSVPRCLSEPLRRMSPRMARMGSGSNGGLAELLAKTELSAKAPKASWKVLGDSDRIGVESGTATFGC